jgi:hypothetical protein
MGVGDWSSERFHARTICFLHKHQGARELRPGSQSRALGQSLFLTVIWEARNLEAAQLLFLPELPLVPQAILGALGLMGLSEFGLSSFPEA